MDVIPGNVVFDLKKENADRMGISTERLTTQPDGAESSPLSKNGGHDLNVRPGLKLNSYSSAGRVGECVSVWVSVCRCG